MDTLLRFDNVNFFYQTKKEEVHALQNLNFSCNFVSHLKVQSV